MCLGLPLVIVPLITFAAAKETTASLAGVELTNAVNKLKPTPVFNRQTDPFCQAIVFFSPFFPLLLNYLSTLHYLYFSLKRICCTYTEVSNLSQHP